MECESYKKIAKSIGKDPGEILFITDIVKGMFNF
jgi:methionine salvage enolase-phosphatase E1